MAQRWLFNGIVWFKGWNKADVMSMSATTSRAQFRELSLPPDLFIGNYMGVAMPGELSKYSRDNIPSIANLARKTGSQPAV
jgi:hypothetical protein